MEPEEPVHRLGRCHADRQGPSRRQARGRAAARSDLIPDVVHTSRLKRAILTANLALEAADLSWLDTHRSWRLNERHYGALQGKDKKEIREEFGEEQFMTWRRSFDTPPPALSDASEFSQAHDPRYANLGDSVPRTECLADVIDRLLPYWYDVLVPELADGRTVLVVAHGNSLRALVKHLDGISDATSRD